MKSILPSLVSGFVGGLLAFVAGFLFVTGRVGTNEILSIHYSPIPEQTKLLTLLESAPRPSGYYVRYRNDDSVFFESAHFTIRAYKDGKLWQAWDVSDYFDVAPGSEREAILAPFSFESAPLPDLSGFDVKVDLLYASKKTEA